MFSKPPMLYSSVKSICWDSAGTFSGRKARALRFTTAQHTLNPEDFWMVICEEKRHTECVT